MKRFTSVMASFWICVFLIAAFPHSLFAADARISDLPSLTDLPSDSDVFPIVDVSDTGISSSGKTKKITPEKLMEYTSTAYPKTEAKLIAAIANASTPRVVLSADVTLSAPLTIPSGTTFTTIPGFVLTTTAANTLTFAAGSHLEDNGEQMFDASPGEVVFSAGSVPSINVDMFGADTSGAQLSTNAMQCAVASANNTLIPIVGSPGANYLTGEITLGTKSNIDFDGSILTADGTPDTIFAIAGTGYPTIKIKNVEFQGDSTDRIKITGGEIFYLEINNIRSRTGTVTSVIHALQNSNTSAPGGWIIKNINSMGTAYSGYHKYGIHFEKTDPANMSWDTALIEKVMFASSVIGSAAIYVNQTGVANAYLNLSTIRDVYRGEVPSDSSSGTTLNGWFKKCKIEQIYQECGTNGSAVLSGYFIDSSIDQIALYTSIAAPTNVRCVSATLSRCKLSNLFMDFAGSRPYESTAYPVITDTTTSSDNTIIFARQFQKFALASLVGKRWIIVGGKGDNSLDTAVLGAYSQTGGSLPYTVTALSMLKDAIGDNDHVEIKIAGYTVNATAAREVSIFLDFGTDEVEILAISEPGGGAAGTSTPFEVTAHVTGHPTGGTSLFFGALGVHGGTLQQTPPEGATITWDGTTLDVKMVITTQSAGNTTLLGGFMRPVPRVD